MTLPGSNEYKFDWWGVSTTLAFDHGVGAWQLRNEVGSFELPGEIHYARVAPSGNALALVHQTWTDPKEDEGRRFPFRQLVLASARFSVKTIFSGHFDHKRIFWSASGHGLAAVILWDHGGDNFHRSTDAILVSSAGERIDIPRGSIVKDVIVATTGEVMAIHEDRSQGSRIIGADGQKVLYSAPRIQGVQLGLDRRNRAVVRFREKRRGNIRPSQVFLQRV